MEESISSHQPGFKIPKIQKAGTSTSAPVPQTEVEIPEGFELKFASKEEHAEIVQQLARKSTPSSACDDSWRTVAPSVIQLVKNPRLQNKFETYKKNHPSEEHFGYRVVFDQTEQTSIVRNGLGVGSDLIGDIGDPTKGVVVYNSPSLANGGNLVFKSRPVKIIMFRTVRGVQNVVKIGSGDVEPSPKHQCHTPRCDAQMDLANAVRERRLGAVYHYEFDTACLKFKKNPTMILPHAIINFDRQEKLKLGPGIAPPPSECKLRMVCSHVFTVDQKPFKCNVHAPYHSKVLPEPLRNVTIHTKIFKARQLEKCTPLSLLRKNAGKLITSETITLEGPDGESYIGSYAVARLDEVIANGFAYNDAFRQEMKSREEVKQDMEFLNFLRATQRFLLCEIPRYHVCYFPSGPLAFDLGFPVVPNHLHIVVFRRCEPLEPLAMYKTANALGPNMGWLFSSQNLGTIGVSPSRNAPEQKSPESNLKGILFRPGKLVRTRETKKVSFREVLADVREFSSEEYHVKADTTESFEEQRKKADQKEKEQKERNEAFRKAMLAAKNASEPNTSADPEEVTPSNSPMPVESRTSTVSTDSTDDFSVPPPNMMSAPPPSVPRISGFNQPPPGILPRVPIGGIPMPVPPPNFAPPSVLIASLPAMNRPPPPIPSQVTSPSLFAVFDIPAPAKITPLQTDFSIPPPAFNGSPQSTNQVEIGEEDMDMDTDNSMEEAPLEENNKSADEKEETALEIEDREEEKSEPHVEENDILLLAMTQLPPPRAEPKQGSPSVAGLGANLVNPVMTSPVPSVSKLLGSLSDSPRLLALLASKSSSNLDVSGPSAAPEATAAVPETAVDTDLRSSSHVAFSINKPKPPTTKAINVLGEDDDDAEEGKEKEKKKEDDGSKLEDIDYRTPHKSGPRTETRPVQDIDERLLNIPLPKEPYIDEKKKRASDQLQEKLRANGKKNDRAVAEANAVLNSPTVGVANYSAFNLANFRISADGLVPTTKKPEEPVAAPARTSSRRSPSPEEPAEPDEPMYISNSFLNQPSCVIVPTESKEGYTTHYGGEITDQSKSPNKRQIEKDLAFDGKSDKRPRIVGAKPRKDSAREEGEISEDDRSKSMVSGSESSSSSVFVGGDDGPPGITRRRDFPMDQRPRGYQSPHGHQQDGHSQQPRNVARNTQQPYNGPCFTSSDDRFNNYRRGNGSSNGNGIRRPLLQGNYLDKVIHNCDPTADNYCILIDLSSGIAPEELQTLLTGLNRIRRNYITPKIHATVFLHKSIEAIINEPSYAEMHRFSPVLSKYIAEQSHLIEILQHHSCDMSNTPKIRSLAKCISDINKQRRGKQAMFISNSPNRDAEAFREFDVRYTTVDDAILYFEFRTPNCFYFS